VIRLKLLIVAIQLTIFVFKIQTFGSLLRTLHFIESVFLYQSIYSFFVVRILLLVLDSFLILAIQEEFKSILEVIYAKLSLLIDFLKMLNLVLLFLDFFVVHLLKGFLLNELKQF